MHVNLSNIYQLRLRGHLNRQWQEWFDGMNLLLAEDGDTYLTGRIGWRSSPLP